MSQVAQVQIVRETLLDIPAIVSLTAHDSIINVFWENVPEGIAYPYIVIFHQYGGDKYETRVSCVDTVWRIVGYTKNHADVPAFSAAIHELAGKELVKPATLNAVLPVGTVQEVQSIYQTDMLQNQTIHMIGGLYRFRMTNI